MNSRLIFLPFVFFVLHSCNKESDNEQRIESTYKGSYKNVNYSETLIGEFLPGVYEEEQIPEELKNLEYGRIEIDFTYNGGGLTYFAPLFYYGSVNKNQNDDYSEEPQFHLAVEIGHYNVIPARVEYLFYTICTYNFPQYCRDTYFPIIPGMNYSVVIDKKPEGIILQLKEGNNILNIFPHAFFPDSVQMFFKDVTSYTNAHKGDSLKNVLMVGKGFAGIEKGIHEYNGEIFKLKIYEYHVSDEDYEYEMLCVRNQHTENQHITYTVNDKLFGKDKYIILRHEFQPYRFESGKMIPDGEIKTREKERIRNNTEMNYLIKKEEIGFYKIFLKTVDEDGNVLTSTTNPFEVWVYPKEWMFEFY